MTAKQEAFCYEYIKDYNGTQSAIRAGYSKKTAGVQAEQLLKKLEISSLLSDLSKQVQSQAIISVIERKELLSKLAMRAEPNIAIKAIDMLNKMEGIYLRCHLDSSEQVQFTIFLD